MPKSQSPSSYRKKYNDTITRNEFNRLSELRNVSVQDTSNRKRAVYVFKVGEYIKVLGHKMDPKCSHPDHQFWVGNIKEIARDPKERRNQLQAAWLVVQWLWSGDDIKQLCPEIQTSHFGHYERSKSSTEDIIHSTSIAGHANVVTFRESDSQESFTRESFYVRSEFDLRGRRVKYWNSNVCGINGCNNPYEPDNDTNPIHYCPQDNCRRWYHMQCLESKTNTIDVNHFSNAEHHKMGLILSIPGQEPVRGPMGKKRRDAAKMAANINLGEILNSLGSDAIRKNLIMLASQQVVRPTADSVAGNTLRVMKARMWISRASKSELSKEDIKQLTDWLENIREYPGYEAPFRAGSQYNPFTCPDCGNPI